MPTARISSDWTSIDVSKPTLHIISKAAGRDLQTYCYRRWNHFLGIYSQRAMTDPLDKLAALAGMAKRVQHLLRCKYLFGIWEGDLIRSLLWKSGASFGNKWAIKRLWPGRVCRFPKRAPSWSWASMEGFIHLQISVHHEPWFQDLANHRIRIVSHAAVPDSLDPIHENLSVPAVFQLLVQGVLKPVRWMTKTAIQLDLPSVRKLVTALSTNNRFGFPLFEGNLPLPGSSREELEKHVLGFCNFDVPDDIPTGQVYALRITTREGILLESAGETRYRRVGYFNVRGEEWDQSSFTDNWFGQNTQDIILI